MSKCITACMNKNEPKSLALYWNYSLFPSVAFCSYSMKVTLRLFWWWIDVYACSHLHCSDSLLNFVPSNIPSFHASEKAEKIIHSRLRWKKLAGKQVMRFERWKSLLLISIFQQTIYIDIVGHIARLLQSHHRPEPRDLWPLCSTLAVVVLLSVGHDWVQPRLSKCTSDRISWEF